MARAEASAGLVRRPRRKEHRAFTRANILTAAETLFRQRGVDTTSMADIASLAETGVGTLYGYFPSKEELLREILHRLSQGAIERCLSAAARGDDHLDRLLTILGVYGDFLLEHRQLLRAAFVSGARNDLDSEIVEPLYVAFCGFVQAGINDAAFRPVPVENTVRVLMTGYMMAILRLGAWTSVEGEAETRADLEQIVTALLSRGG